MKQKGSFQIGLPRMIGVIHLAPLPGSPRAFREFGQDPKKAMDFALKRAVAEARTFDSLGLDGVIVENFGDVPFFSNQVPPETISAMAQITGTVVNEVKIPVGVNVLRNDFMAALGIAATTGAEFVRINILSGVAATDQGIISGQAAEWIRARDRLCPKVQILADVLVKHARTLSVSDVDLAIEEMGLRAAANGVVVTGPTTGRAMERSFLKKAAETARNHGIPLWIGSGATLETIPWMTEHSDGFIIGSAFRKDGKAGAPLDAGRIRTVMKALAY